MALIGTASAMCLKLCPLRRCLLPARNTCLFHYATRTGETWRKIQRRLYSFHRQHMSTQRTSFSRPHCVCCALRNITSRTNCSLTRVPTITITISHRTVVTEKTAAAEKTITSKKRPARKKTQEKMLATGVKPVVEEEAIADHKNMAAYAIGDELYIDKLEEALREQDLYHVVTLPGDITDTLMASAKYRVDGKAREIFFFEGGSVVCWNMPASEELEILSIISLESYIIRHMRLEVVKFAQKYAENYHPIQTILDESEIMNVATGGTSKLKGNTVNIKEVTDPTSFQGSKEEKSIILEKFAFSNALAQSVTLSIKEAALDAFVDTIEPRTEDLRDGKDLRMSRSTLNKKQGEVFLIRHDINLRSDLLDTPDVYWEREELEILYKSMRTYLNIPTRTKVMNEKLNYCTQILDLFSSQMNDERHVRLEWFIIVLILIEVGFECIHYGERFFERRQIQSTQEIFVANQAPVSGNVNNNES